MLKQGCYKRLRWEPGPLMILDAMDSAKYIGMQVTKTLHDELAIVRIDQQSVPCFSFCFTIPSHVQTHFS